MSRVYLPQCAAAPRTVLEFLVARFPHVSAGAWRQRIAGGSVTATDGSVLGVRAAYRPGTHVLYRREVPLEPGAREPEAILCKDAHLVVADKPHGMTVTPAGDQVERSLLVRLRRRTGFDDLVPVHRLDRDTAGVILFSIQAEERGVYHALFAEGRIEREYMAVAHVPFFPERRLWRVCNRIQAGTPWYKQRVVDGDVNAVTEVELTESEGSLGLFRIRPRTGKKHQIRLHMASIGFPIVGDSIYAVAGNDRGSKPPLQLIASRLEFTDPVTGARREFNSERQLEPIKLL